MLKTSDLYSTRQTFTLKQSDADSLNIESLKNTAQASEYGFGVITYNVQQVIDTSNMVSKRCYDVTCTTRLVIPNEGQYSMAPKDINSFTNYPALLNFNIKLNENETIKINNEKEIKIGKINATLTDYTPRTLNTNNTTAGNTNDGQNTSISSQHTSGSSISQTNSYSANLSLGFQGKSAMGSVGGSASHSRTNTTDNSMSDGTNSGDSSSSGASVSLSIKDWGCYSQVSSNGISPSWLWGQEYPWDVIQCTNVINSGNQILLPVATQARLANLTTTPAQIFPPSHLSRFGIDFSMMASWRIELPEALDDQIVSFSHSANYSTASHEIQSNNDGTGQETLVVTLDAEPAALTIPPTVLDLTLLGLDPIDPMSAEAGTVIGFVENKFVSTPPKAGSSFKILSGNNNVQVSGRGFDAPMQTTFAHGEVNLHVFFKITDDINPYNLYLKNWVNSESGCELTIIFNGNKSLPLTIAVTDEEGQGGNNNITEINMRNKDFASINYHDYLVIGLNTVDITIKKINQAHDTQYFLRAIAISD